MPRAHARTVYDMQTGIAPCPSRTSRFRRMLELALASLYGLSSRTGFDLPRAKHGTVELVKNEIRRIDEADGARFLEVLEGTVWITATPAAGDVLLRAGDCLALDDRWPFVAQALEPARLLLAPRAPSASRMRPLSSRLAPSPKKYR